MPGARANDDILCMIATVATAAVKDASTYFQTVASIGATPKRIGFPAYQKAGIKRIQKETVQAAATPAGPHRGPKNNRIRSLPSRVRIAPIAIPINARMESPFRK